MSNQLKTALICIVIAVGIGVGFVIMGIVFIAMGYGVECEEDEYNVNEEFELINISKIENNGYNYWIGVIKDKKTGCYYLHKVIELQEENRNLHKLLLQSKDNMTRVMTLLMKAEMGGKRNE